MFWSVPDTETFHFKRLSITSAMSDVEFDNNETITADSIELNLAMGDFTCSTVEAENFNATVSMGNFTGRPCAEQQLYRRDCHGQL